MSQYMPYPPEQHKAHLICGDPRAEAYEWISRYAENLSGSADPDDEDYYGSQTVTAEELIETALSNIEEEADGWGDYITKGPLLEGVSVDPTFWEKLMILRDIEIPDEKQNDFFSCSC